MDWNKQAFEQLREADDWTYHAGGESFAEPAALTALALIAEGELEAASRPAKWLLKLQSDDGSIGVSETEASPNWPTALAISVWRTWQTAAGKKQFSDAIKKAQHWAFDHQGETTPRQNTIAHDTSLRGWSWAIGTHAWLEPSCMFVTALFHSGLPHHPKTAEAIRLIVDRQLENGGFNYGNTIVLGQELLPHVQSTGLALSTLSFAKIHRDRVAKSIAYLHSEWPETSSTASLSYAAMGLSAYDESPPDLSIRLAECYANWQKRNGGIYKLALIALASQQERCLLLPQGAGNHVNSHAS